MPFKRGDEVVCKIPQAYDSDRYDEHKLQIIGFGNAHFSDHLLCYVPPYITIKASFLLTAKHQKEHQFPNKFIGEYATLVDESQVIRHLPAIPGVFCSKCGTFVQHVEAPGGYTCRHCRENPYR